jgi:hypothetical protein
MIQTIEQRQADAAQQRYEQEVIAQTWVDELFLKYPTITTIQSMDAIIPAVIEGMRELGIYSSPLSVKKFWAGFKDAVDSKTIRLPKPVKVDVASAVTKLAAAFPPVVSAAALARQKRDDAALAGISAQSGRLTVADRVSESKKIDNSYQQERNHREQLRLRAEYKSLKVAAETLMSDSPKSHGQNAAARKEALARLNADPRFASVRE